jgi:hypothetical protein
MTPNKEAQEEVVLVSFLQLYQMPEKNQSTGKKGCFDSWVQSFQPMIS